jgi:hypothetical protein
VKSVRSISRLLAVLCFAQIPVCAADIWEPNDSFEQATEILPPGIGGLTGRSLNAQVESHTAGDWYSRAGQSVADKWVSAWIEDLPGGQDGSAFDTVLDLQHGETGAVVSSNDDINESLPIHTSGLVGAPVPVGVAPVFSVRGFNQDVQGPYRLYTLVNLANSQDVVRDQVESEPNDSVNEAQLLSNGDNVRGTILSANEEDWFRVEMGTPNGWDLYVALRNLSEGAADFVVEVWKPFSVAPLSGTLLAGGIGENDFLVIPFGDHAAGMKFFRIRSATGTGNYRLFFGAGAPTPLGCSDPSLSIPDGTISVVTDTLLIRAKVRRREVTPARQIRAQRGETSSNSGFSRRSRSASSRRLLGFTLVGGGRGRRILWMGCLVRVGMALQDCSESGSPSCKEV